MVIFSPLSSRDEMKHESSWGGIEEKASGLHEQVDCRFRGSTKKGEGEGELLFCLIRHFSSAKSN